MNLPVARVLVAGRRRSTLWWALALALIVLLIVASFTTMDGNQAIEDSFGDLPESVMVLMGIDAELTLTSPAGYLNSQLFANMLPLLLTVFAIGLGARIVAGDEDDGTLELVLAHPVDRRRVALERAAAAVGLLVLLGVVCAATLVLSAPLADLDLGVDQLTAATATSVLLGLLHGAVAFGAGCATGSRAIAITAGAGLTAAGFIVQSLALLSDTLRPLRWASPWQWFLDRPAILDGWASIIVPGLGTLAAVALVGGLGLARFARRDVGHA